MRQLQAHSWDFGTIGNVCLVVTVYSHLTRNFNSLKLSHKDILTFLSAAILWSHLHKMAVFILTFTWLLVCLFFFSPYRTPKCHVLLCWIWHIYFYSTLVKNSEACVLHIFTQTFTPPTHSPHPHTHKRNTILKIKGEAYIIHSVTF